MNHIAGLVELTRPATLHEFSCNEPRSLDELAGCSFTLTPDLMRPDLWSWEDAPQVAVLVAASACWDGSGLRAYPWPSTSTARFCCSSGFVFGRRAGGFPFSSDDYYEWLKAMRPDVAAIFDLPCEAEIGNDEVKVERLQRWTLEAAGELMRWHHL